VQQIEACHNVMGIPQEFTIDMTGQMSPPQRAEHWQSLRIFFCHSTSLGEGHPVWRLCAWWLMKPIEQLAITHTVWSFVSFWQPMYSCGYWH
jgi:hypothetical protein